MLCEDARAVGPNGPVGEMWRGGVLAQVVDDQPISASLKVRRHARTHGAQTNETDQPITRRCHALTSFQILIVWRTRISSLRTQDTDYHVAFSMLRCTKRSHFRSMLRGLEAHIRG